LAELTGISHTSLRKYIPSMIKLGWCSVINGHLCFKGINKFKQVKILIPICETKSLQVLEFRNAIIKNNIDKQIKQVKFKSELVKRAKGVNTKLTPKEIMYLRKNPNVEKTINEPTLSNRRFGSLINRSKYTGQRLKQRLRQNELIKTKSRFKLIKNNCTVHEYNYLYYGKGYILEQGNLYQRQSDAIVCKQKL